MEPARVPFGGRQDGKASSAMRDRVSFDESAPAGDNALGMTSFFAKISIAALVAASGLAGIAAAPILPAWAQTAPFDDTEAQLRIRQAATAASTAARKVDTLRQELRAERQRVVQTDGERELNQAAVKALEQELRTAEDRQRELDAALADAQDARIRGAAAEAERRRREEGQRPPPSPPSQPTASAPAPAPAPPPPQVPAAATTSETMELAAWNAVAASTNPAMFEAFLAQFPRGVFAPMARVRLDELKSQTDGEAKRRAAAEAKRLAEEEARRKTEGEAEARRQAERDEAALRLGDRDRQRIQIALTSLGFNTAGTDGVLGPRSREMIAAWQKARSQPSTGFVTVLNQQMLLHEAAAALSKHDEEQKRVEEDRKKAEAEKARIQAQTPAPPPAPAPAPAPAPPPAKVEAKPRTEQALAAPSGGGSATSTAPPGYDGTYSGMVAYSNGNAQALSIRVANGTGSGAVTNPRCGKVTIGLRIDANGNAVIRVEGYDGRCMSNLNTYASTVVNNQIRTSWSNPNGRTELTLIRQ